MRTKLLKEVARGLEDAKKRLLDPEKELGDAEEELEENGVINSTWHP